jgi:hypothetical protein
MSLVTERIPYCSPAKPGEKMTVGEDAHNQAMATDIRSHGLGCGSLAKAKALRLIILGLDLYRAKNEADGDKLGDDGVIGDAWGNIVNIIRRTLLNGDTGGLDARSVDECLRNMMVEAGFTEKEIECEL